LTLFFSILISFVVEFKHDYTMVYFDSAQQNTFCFKETFCRYYFNSTIHYSNYDLKITVLTWKQQVCYF